MRRRREAQRRLEYLLRLVNEMNTRNEAIETQYVALTDELHSTGLREASLDTGTAERLDKRLQDIRQLARAKVHEQEDTSFEIGAVSRMETEATWQLVPTTLDLHIDVLPVRNHNAALWTLTNCTSNNSSTRSGNTDSDEYIEEDLDVLSQVSDNANLDKPEATKALECGRHIIPGKQVHAGKQAALIAECLPIAVHTRPRVAHRVGMSVCSAPGHKAVDAFENALAGRLGARGKLGRTFLAS
ncbi:uncharacterized protein LOC113146796 [Cyclospora cayetanensis]|uniref:Uncharacterized protein LOC113146796 n=1 Tax=Cyclospora cayetanensis TaxID=88456 RepID=A0A6P6RU29_9EIME|nr:uncharacterized protein LOC113146796 [Cyclospora cayetanensis]